MKHWPRWLAGLCVLLATVTLWFERHRETQSHRETLTAASLPQSGSTTQSGPTTQPAPIAATLYQRVNPAVVTIVSAGELTSGSIIDSEGWIVTTKHGIHGVTVEVKTVSGKTYSGRVRAIEYRHDLALVSLTTLDRFPTVPLATTSTLQPGQPVYAIGSPAGRSGTLTSGRFRGVTPQGSLQTSPGLLHPGNSGGPLLNAAGEMIGVNKGLLEDGSGLATSLEATRAFIQDGGRSLKAASHQ